MENLDQVCIKHLSPSEKFNSLEEIIKELSRADDNTLKISDISEDICTNEYDVWTYSVNDKVHYYLLAQIIGSSYFVMRVAGGGGLFPWPLFIESALPYIKSKDLEEISFQGGRSWEKKLGGLGFSIKEYVYSFKV